MVIIDRPTLSSIVSKMDKFITHDGLSVMFVDFLFLWKLIGRKLFHMHLETEYGFNTKTYLILINAHAIRC